MNYDEFAKEIDRIRTDISVMRMKTSSKELSTVLSIAQGILTEAIAVAARIVLAEGQK